MYVPRETMSQDPPKELTIIIERGGSSAGFLAQPDRWDGDQYVVRFKLFKATANYWRYQQSLKKQYFNLYVPGEVFSGCKPPTFLQAVLAR